VHFISCSTALKIIGISEESTNVTIGSFPPFIHCRLWDSVEDSLALARMAFMTVPIHEYRDKLYTVQYKTLDMEVSNHQYSTRSAPVLPTHPPACPPHAT
jgi:hypothetical protein